MSLNIIVLVKQVPDTRCVGPDAMTPEGTVNRSALPAIFNPDDLVALEQALRLKDEHEGTRVTVLTMGLPKAAEVLRESLFRGADDAVLLTDRALGGADTLATSYALAMAVRKVGVPDLILSGRQAIDGDTAQVGPQVAEKLALPQVTCVEEIEQVAEDRLILRRRIDGGVERVEAPVPCLLTIVGGAAKCRPCNAKLVLAHKRTEPAAEGVMRQWSAADIDADLEQCGLKGSPTKVKEVRGVAFKAKESRRLTDDETELDGLMKELIANHIIG